MAHAPQCTDAEGLVPTLTDASGQQSGQVVGSCVDMCGRGGVCFCGKGKEKRVGEDTFNGAK